MSAILAIFNRNQQPVPEQWVQAMLAASCHRARDGQASLHIGGIALAHQHFWLTFQESQEPHDCQVVPQQPFVDEAQYAITCDARLDNRAALMASLQLERPIGQPLTDNANNRNGDAALILRAYRQWGVACVRHLLGDFAFALWDPIKRHLFVARDALGARDLHYYLDRERCLVASEIKQLLAHPAVEPRLNEGKVAEYLAGLWHKQEETFYQDIFCCPPAHCLLVSAEGVRKWRYWDLNPDRRIRYRHEATYAEHFLELLQQAVQCRLPTTGRVGISLSGGLDSTCVAALAATQLSSQLKSFSYVFDELSSCDERAFIQPVVSRYDLDATYIPADNKWTLRDSDCWPVMADFVISNAYIWLPLSVLEAAHQAGCRVLLNGHFADALFAGGQFWAEALLREFRWRDLIVNMVNAHPYRASLSIRRDLLHHGFYQLIPRRLKQLYRVLRPTLSTRTHAHLHPDLIKRTHLAQRAREIFNTTKNSSLTSSQWQRYRTLTLGSQAQGISAIRQLYHTYDIEPAMPFWDRRLIEYVMALPADQLGRAQHTKWILREAMSGWLPEPVRQRIGKTSFYPLFKKGIFKHERLTVNKLLTNPQIVQRQFICPKWLEQEMTAGPRHDDGYALWLAISLELWLRRYWKT